MTPAASGGHSQQPMTGPDAEAAARALLAVLGHPDVATSVDERLFEALLVYGLQAIPGLGAALFACDAEVEFTLGRRGSQADIVGLRHGVVVMECEIKLHSNVHWPGGRVCQLDNYADRAPAEAALCIVTDQDRMPHLRAELADDEYPVHSRDRWKILHHHAVRDAVERTVGPLARGDGSAERLARALARLVEAEAPSSNDDQAEAAGGDG